MKYLFLVLLTTLSCVTTTVQNPLSEQILRARPGHEGLTNRVCLREKFGECQEERISVYSLENEEFRKLVNQIGFICDVAGRRFKICLDKPGFCRIDSKKICKFFTCKEEYYVSEFVPGNNIDLLVALNIKCFNPKVYGE